jgi:SMP-30/Gluconolactonase/LRE-like region
MGESPRWHGGRFWMCDWLAGEVLAFGTDGSREVMARVEGLPFSIHWLPDGHMVATTPKGVMAGPDLVPYGAAGQPFNEIVVDAVGRVWVDMPGSMPCEERQPGIVAVVLPDGSWRQVADDVWFPARRCRVTRGPTSFGDAGAALSGDAGVPDRSLGVTGCSSSATTRQPRRRPCSAPCPRRFRQVLIRVRGRPTPAGRRVGRRR